MDYAERGVSALGNDFQAPVADEYDSMFEKHVAEQLRARGLEVHTRVGCAAYRLDLAVVDPRNPERYVLGIECDGESYRSALTARDRDRLRQSVLEGLGWRILRVWSTDWVRNSERQIERVLSEFQRAVELKSGALPSVETTLDLSGSDLNDGKNEAPVVLKLVPRQPKPHAPQHKYSTIQDVSDDRLAESIQQQLELYGAMEKRDLVRAVSRSLGFRRTSKRIGEVIEYGIEKLCDAERIQRCDEGRLILVRTG